MFYETVKILIKIKLSKLINIERLLRNIVDIK